MVAVNYGADVESGLLPLRLTAAGRRELEKLAASPSQPHRRVVTARALLLAADGVPTGEIARRCATTPNSVRRWIKRFTERGIDSVGTVAPGRGRKPVVRQAVATAIARDTLLPPPPGSSRWTVRQMASRHGVSKDTVARVWQEQGIRPWTAAVGEPSPAITRPDPPRTSGKGQAEVANVLVALDQATGLALSRCRPQESHRDFLFFVKVVEAVELWVEHWDDPTRAFTWQDRDELTASTKRARAALAKYFKSATGDL